MELTKPSQNSQIAPVKKKSFFKRHGVDKYTITKKVSRRENTVLYLFGTLVFYVGLALIVPLICSYIFNDPYDPWIITMLICFLFSIPLLMRFKSAEHTRSTETLFVITTSWILVTIFGSLPFILSGMDVIDALFESMSGFTTTGSTIMGGGGVAPIEEWSKSILLWRSMMQWLGGAGIIMIFVTILPMMGATGRSLVTLELAGTDTQNITQRMQEESRKFHYIYLSLTLLMIVMLLLTGLGVYDSATIALSSISTGGLSPYSDSISHFNSRIVEWIVIIFMFLGGTNFFLQFRAMSRGGYKELIKNSEFRVYVLIVIIASLILFAFLGPEVAGMSTFDRFTASTFQIISAMTSTGYTTISLGGLVNIASLILIIAMIIGGSSGSTAGGIKIVRFVILRKFLSATLYRTIHPKAVVPIKINEKTVEEKTVSSLMALLVCYFGTAVVCIFILMMLGVDTMGSVCSTIASLSNAGLGMGDVASSYGGLPDLAKLVLMFAMWAGRLEFISVFVILSPVFWKEFLRFHKRYS